MDAYSRPHRIPIAWLFSFSFPIPHSLLLRVKKWQSAGGFRVQVWGHPASSFYAAAYIRSIKV